MTTIAKLKALLAFLAVISICSLFLYHVPPAHALPSGGQVGEGAAAIHQPNAQSLRIDQMSDRALLNWQGFSIGQGETVQFVQPSATSLAVNRVLGGDPSLILGQLLANGRVFLLNPNGVLFGPHATVNVGGLMATTLSLKSYDLTTGRFELAQDPTKALASVVNQGTLRVAEHGFLVLAAPGVVNDGLIVAKFGQVGLAAGTQLAVDFRGDGLIQYAVEGKVLDQVTDPNGQRLTNALSNAGHIEADGGTVLLTAQASSAVVSSVINQTGVIQARRLESQGGEIVLRGGDNGVVLAGGTLDASGPDVGQLGGSIAIRGEKIALTETAQLDVSGNAGGGNITVGGEFQGQGAGKNARAVSVRSGASLSADAISQGDGGTIVVWADGVTRYAGHATARGGAIGGNGGLIETSGKEQLSFLGTVDLRAPQGRAGTLLLDPKFFIVQAGGLDSLSGNEQFFENPSGTATVSGANLAAAIDAGNVTISVNTDFILDDNVTATTDGNGFTIRAGRSVIFEPNRVLTLNNGHFTAMINHIGAFGNRDAGPAQFVMNSGSQVLTNGGNLTLVRGGTAFGQFSEMRIGNGSGPAVINAGSGDVFIEGFGNPGIVVDSGSAIQGNGVTLRGSGVVATGGMGVRLTGAGTMVTATGGALEIEGTGTGVGATNVGIELLEGASVTSPGFPIALKGSGADTALGIRTASSGADNIIDGSSGGSEITLMATTASGADSLDLANLQILGSTLILEPLGAADSIGIAGGAGVFNLSVAELDLIQTGDSVVMNLLIGRNSTAWAGTINIGSSVGPTGYTFNVPVDIGSDLAGSTITVDGPLTMMNDNSLQLRAGTQITVTATGSVTQADTGNLILISDSLALSANSINGTGLLVLAPPGSTTSIGIGDGAAGTFLVDNATLQAFGNGFSFIQIGSTGGEHAITVETVTFQNPVIIQSALVGGGGSITVNGALATTGTNSISLGADAHITVTPTGSLTTATGTLSLTSDVLALNGAADSISGGNVLTLQPSQGSTSIGIGDGAAGTFNVTNTELLTLKDGFTRISIGQSSGSHVIEITNETFRDHVIIQSPALGGGGSITVNGSLETTGTDSLTLSTDAQITVAPTGSLTTETGDITLTADALALGGAADSVSGGGQLRLQPRQVTTSIGIGASAVGTFNLTSTELLTIKDGFSSIAIGHSLGEHVIDIRSVTFRDPVTIQTTQGGGITVNGTLTAVDEASITFLGSGATTTLNADIVTEGQPIVIDDSVIVAGGTDTNRTLDTTNGGAFPAGADITVTGTINAGTSSPNNESLTVTGGTTGDVALGSGDLVIPTYDQPIGGTQPLRNLTGTGDVMNFPQTTLTGALSATGATANFNGQVVVGADGIITMVYSEGMFLFADMLSPNAVLTAIGPVTLMHDVVLDVGLGTLTMQNTVNTQSFNFTLRGNGIDLLGGGGSIIGTGTNVLELAPGTPDTSLGIADGAGTLQLDAAELTPIGTGVNGFATVRLGRADSTATITLGTYTAPYAVTIQADAPGGEGAIHVTGAFATGPAGESLTLLASKNIVVNPGASLTTNNGPIMLSSNAAGTATGNFVGIDLNGATLNSGSGPLTLLGKGGTTGNDNIGVRLTNNAQMQGGSGLVTLIGVGGNGGTGQQNVGVSLQGGSQVTTTTGGIQVTGTGGTNALDQGGLPTGQFNRGVQLITGAQVLSTGSGPITMVGQGGASGTIDHGLAINSRIASAGGAIDLTGNAGGTPTGMNNHGLILANGAQVEGTGPASIHLKGTGGQGIASDSVHGEAGVYIIGTNGTFVRTQAGALTLEGTGGGTSFGGYGVIVRFGAVVESTGGGAVLVKGTGSPTGTAFNHGVIVYEAGTTIRATGTAALTLAPGQGGGTWYNNYGVMVGNGALVEHLGTGQITITGTGGGNGDNEPSNFGVLLLGATTQIKALQGEIVITGTGAGTPPATGVFQVNSPVIQDQNTPTIISNP